LPFSWKKKEKKRKFGLPPQNTVVLHLAEKIEKEKGRDRSARPTSEAETRNRGEEEVAMQHTRIVRFIQLLLVIERSGQKERKGERKRATAGLPLLHWGRKKKGSQV